MVKYVCAKCSEVFTHTAIATDFNAITKNGAPDSAFPFPSSHFQVHVCPFCHNIKFTEYIEPEEELLDVISVDYVGVGQKISEGYKVKEIYAKSVTLVKPKPKQPKNPDPDANEAFMATGVSI